MREYNIFHVDSVIREELISKISTLPELEKDLWHVLKILESGNISDKTTAQQQSSMLRRRIQDLQSTFELTFYIHRTADILEKYNSLLISKNSRSFVCTNKEDSDKESKTRAELVSQYITIAKDYVNIENYYQKPDPLVCPSCQSDDMQRHIDDESTFVCAVCATEVEILDDTPTFKDTDRVNMSNRYTYSRRGHFMEAMRKYQGKHNTNIELLQTVVDVLLSEMNLHGLTCETVTKDEIYMFLSEKKLSGHYDDINLLYQMINGCPCPEFTHLEGELLELFEQQEKALEEVTQINENDERINSINVYYKLYKLLQKLGYPCRKGDFYILKTKTKEDEHDEKMKKAWHLNNWLWIETF
jgi:hypothetical protein